MQKKRTFKAAFTCRWAPSDGENGKDGVGIKSADVVFATSTSGISAPADSAGWVTLFVDLELKENTYVWSCTKTVLTDGATTYTGKQCLGASKDFVTITEQYAVGSSGTTPPTSGWGTNYTPTKELWLWTRNRMQWTNGAYTYTTAICIGYFGKDGENGENGETSFNVSISSTAIVAHQSAEKQIFEITLQATRGSVLLKYYTDYTCSTLSDTNKITDGLVWGFDGVTGNSSFKYKLALLANAIVNVDIPFYVTDKRTSMKYPFKISFTTVKDGDKGGDGVPGLIQRVSEWTAGAEYHNDEKLTSNIRYLDIVTVTDNTTGDFRMYQCRETHTSTASNAPKSTDTAQWLKLNNMRPIYTPLIIAKNAVLRFGQTNSLLIMDTEGKKIQGCITGVDDPTKPMAWFGGETASAAKTTISYDGKFKSEEADIKGKVTLRQLSYREQEAVSGQPFDGACISNGDYILPRLKLGEFRVIRIFNLFATRVAVYINLKGEDSTVKFLWQDESWETQLRDSLTFGAPDVGEIIGFTQAFTEGRYYTIWKVITYAKTEGEP